MKPPFPSNTFFLIFFDAIAVASGEDEFIDLDCSNDSKINISEFEEFANILAEDSI